MSEVRPAEPDYPQRLDAIAEALTPTDSSVLGAAVYVPLVDRGTRYNLVLVLASELVRVGGNPEGLSGHPYLLVAVVDHGAYWFRVERAFPGYVQQKLNLAGDADGEVLAEFITALSERLEATP